MPDFQGKFELRFFPIPDKNYLIDYFYHAQTSHAGGDEPLFTDDVAQEHPWAAYAPQLLIFLAAANFAAFNMQNQSLAAALNLQVAQLRREMFNQSIAREMQNLELQIKGEYNAT